MLIQLFKEYLTPFLNNCLALRDQHIFTMAILKLVHGLVERGALDVNACGSLVPSFKSMLAEDDPFTAAKDDSWKIGMRLLLRIKLAAASTLHLMLDRAAHDSALKSFQQEKAGRIVPLSRTESTQGQCPWF